MPEQTDKPAGKSEKEKGDDAGLATWKKTVSGWKDWIIRVFKELIETRIQFWLPPRAKVTDDILLSICCIALFYFARNRLADYSQLQDAPLATAVVAIAAFGASCLGCAVDPKCRADFVQCANDCYRVMIVGAILTAVLLAAGHLLPWDVTLDRMLGYASYQDTKCQIVARCATVAILAFAIVALNSLAAAKERATVDGAQPAEKEPVRIGLWSLYFLLSFFGLSLIMFFSKSN